MLRTFEVECPNCDAELDVDIEETDLQDTELVHTVVCEECKMESEFFYDSESDDLEPFDEYEGDDDESEDAVDEIEGAE